MYYSLWRRRHWLPFPETATLPSGSIAVEFLWNVATWRRQATRRYCCNAQYLAKTSIPVVQNIVTIKKTFYQMRAFIKRFYVLLGQVCLEESVGIFSCLQHVPVSSRGDQSLQLRCLPLQPSTMTSQTITSWRHACTYVVHVNYTLTTAASVAVECDVKCGGEELLAKCELECEIGGVEVRKTFVDEPLLDERLVVTLTTHVHIHCIPWHLHLTQWSKMKMLHVPKIGQETTVQVYNFLLWYLYCVYFFNLMF